MDPTSLRSIAKKIKSAFCIINSKKGEIATLLTIAGLAVMVIGGIVGSSLNRKPQTTATEAQQPPTLPLPGYPPQDNTANQHGYFMNVVVPNPPAKCAVQLQAVQDPYAWVKLFNDNNQNGVLDEEETSQSTEYFYVGYLGPCAASCAGRNITLEWTDTIVVNGQNMIRLLVRNPGGTRTYYLPRPDWLGRGPTHATFVYSMKTNGQDRDGRVFSHEMGDIPGCRPTYTPTPVPSEELTPTPTESIVTTVPSRAPTPTRFPTPTCNPNTPGTSCPNTPTPSTPVRPSTTPAPQACAEMVSKVELYRQDLKPGVWVLAKDLVGKADKNFMPTTETYHYSAKAAQLGNQRADVTQPIWHYENKAFETDATYTVRFSTTNPVNNFDYRKVESGSGEENLLQGLKSPLNLEAGRFVTTLNLPPAVMKSWKFDHLTCDGKACVSPKSGAQSANSDRLEGAFRCGQTITYRYYLVPAGRPTVAPSPVVASPSPIACTYQSTVRIYEWVDKNNNGVMEAAERQIPTDLPNPSLVTQQQNDIAYGKYLMPAQHRFGPNFNISDTYWIFPRGKAHEPYTATGGYLLKIADLRNMNYATNSISRGPTSIPLPSPLAARLVIPPANPRADGSMSVVGARAFVSQSVPEGYRVVQTECKDITGTSCVTPKPSAQGVVAIAKDSANATLEFQCNAVVEYAFVVAKKTGNTVPVVPSPTTAPSTNYKTYQLDVQPKDYRGDDRTCWVVLNTKNGQVNPKPGQNNGGDGVSCDVKADGSQLRVKLKLTRPNEKDVTFDVQPNECKGASTQCESGGSNRFTVGQISTGGEIECTWKATLGQRATCKIISKGSSSAFGGALDFINRLRGQ